MGDDAYCKDTAEMLFLIDNQYTVASLGCHKLCSFNDQNILANCQCLSGPEG